jgi:hypothetical protein
MKFTIERGGDLTTARRVPASKRVRRDDEPNLPGPMEALRQQLGRRSNQAASSSSESSGKTSNWAPNKKLKLRPKSARQAQKKQGQGSQQHQVKLGVKRAARASTEARNAHNSGGKENSASSSNQNDKRAASKHGKPQKKNITIETFFAKQRRDAACSTSRTSHGKRKADKFDFIDFEDSEDESGNQSSNQRRTSAPPFSPPPQGMCADLAMPPGEPDPEPQPQPSQTRVAANRSSPARPAAAAQARDQSQGAPAAHLPFAPSRVLPLALPWRRPLPPSLMMLAQTLRVAPLLPPHQAAAMIAECRMLPSPILPRLSPLPPPPPPVSSDIFQAALTLLSMKRARNC